MCAFDLSNVFFSLKKSRDILHCVVQKLLIKHFIPTIQLFKKNYYQKSPRLQTLSQITNNVKLKKCTYEKQKHIKEFRNEIHAFSTPFSNINT